MHSANRRQSRIDNPLTAGQSLRDSSTKAASYNRRTNKDGWQTIHHDSARGQTHLAAAGSAEPGYHNEER